MNVQYNLTLSSGSHHHVELSNIKISLGLTLSFEYEIIIKYACIFLEKCTKNLNIETSSRYMMRKHQYYLKLKVIIINFIINMKCYLFWHSYIFKQTIVYNNNTCDMLIMYLSFKQHYGNVVIL